MVMTVSNILRIESSLNEEARGSTVAVGSTNSSAVGSPDVEGLDVPIERLNPRAFRASFHLSCSLPKESGTYGSYNMNMLGCRKIL